MNDKILRVDVREDIQNGGEPFSKIMSAVAMLRPEQQLLLVAPFEPKPLFAVLAKQGFQHAARQISLTHWEVCFTRTSKSTSAPADFVRPVNCPGLRAPQSEVLDVDARGLEPPQPMIKILETLATLPEDAELRAHTDRRPIHLYAHLEERGFIGESKEQNDGSFITYIRRR